MGECAPGNCVERNGVRAFRTSPRCLAGGAGRYSESAGNDSMSEGASIFVSSVQKELAEERRGVKALVEGDALLRRFFRVFLFGT